MNKDLGIIICNFNKVEYLKGCLETLYKSSFEKLSYDVIVVDNASTDESVEFVKKNYPSIILLQNETNTGGSGGFDRGIQYVMKQNYTYVALLDNDILLESDTILNLIKYIKENPKVGVVGSKICTMDNPEILQEMGSFIDFSEKFNIETPLKGHKDDDSLPEVASCDYVPACCLITTNEVLNKVGSFNIKHFIYWDDMDWCTRVKRAGYEIHAINNSRVFHKMGSSNNTNTFGIYYFERNRILFFLKYLSNKKLQNFIDKTCDWLMLLIFFSNLKGIYPKAISVLLSLDDLLLLNLGRQDERIFPINKQKTLFELYTINNTEKIMLIYEDVKSLNIIKNYLTHSGIEHVNENKIFDKTFLNDYSRIIIISSHLLEIKNIIENEKIIYIDDYFNSCNSTQLKNLINSYEEYKKIFTNIFKPTIVNKLYLIRKNLKA
ncbi:glycosyltransferase family 2 protein [Aliarcobacter skirrowii]|uniref:glycosyltransferase family 2 protein n=1 Tax=Aliarcobacter skirrowii TaxID=28200 RepID=UPI0029A6F1A5|nr:glycosyltransferase family 2 protein [Aliarcobacter skirrowii]MDX4038251.1 glycosyltransferase family 2 protein [Aliarcobacter skirrowii]